MSKIKPLNEDNILDFLQNESSFNDKKDDPITKTEIPVTLDQLQPYELNPRRTRNPAYESILHSIESVGLDHPPRITRRNPDDEKYSIRDGGNTRLEILKELYDKYKELAENEKDINLKQSLLEKADSFYCIKCDFYPWYDDTQALAAHMRENENRGEIKFIEKALAVQQLHKLYLEEDREIATGKGEQFNKDKLSLRELSDRISNEGGWKVDNSHISRFNYTSNILLDIIPDALWAGAGEPVVTKVRKLFKAYETFWLATDQGKKNPDEINDLFYKTLAAYDGDKVDLDSFTQDLDMRLEDIVKIPSVSIMAEINALIRGSKRSLKHEPEALNHRLTAQTDDTNTELNQSAGSSDINDSTGDARPVIQAAKTSPESTTPKDKTTSRAKPKEAQSPSSTESNPNDTSNVPIPLVQTDELPSDIPVLNALVLEQLKCIEKLTPGYLGISRMNDVNDAYIQEGVLYDVNDFYDHELHPCPVYGNPDDDMRTIIWWQLQKYSRDYMINNHGQFTKLMQRSLASYIETVQEVNAEHQLIDVTLWLEHRLLLYPDILKECVKLQRLQTRIIEVSRNQHQSME